ncbi:hypothetical protein HYT02_05300 [Candidatus Gottesmanbacteria bacterium]|nr:hypothetical protein [Candidatus Gottesmanbacteria bacterium]
MDTDTVRDKKIVSQISPKNNILSYLIVILITIIFSVSSILIYQKQMSIKNNQPIDLVEKLNIQPTLTVSMSENQYTRVAGCNGDECLFQGNPEVGAVEGYGHLRGYFYLLDDVDHNGPVVCDTLVVTDGSQPLIDDLKAWVKRGNTINTINENEQLVANIYLDNLNLTDQQLITNSTSDNPVDLSVIRKTPEGRGAPACESFLDIIKVN